MKKYFSIIKARIFKIFFNNNILATKKIKKILEKKIKKEKKILINIFKEKKNLNINYKISNLYIKMKLGFYLTTNLNINIS